MQLVAGAPGRARQLRHGIGTAPTAAPNRFATYRPKRPAGLRPSAEASSGLSAREAGHAGDFGAMAEAVFAQATGGTWRTRSAAGRRLPGGTDQADSRHARGRTLAAGDSMPSVERSRPTYDSMECSAA